jgi:hypothetical protein
MSATYTKEEKVGTGNKKKRKKDEKNCFTLTDTVAYSGHLVPLC